MPQDIIDQRITLNITPREALEFLNKLSTDDQFRSRLEGEPSRVLAEHHIYIPLDKIPDAVLLPSKETLQQALTKFREHGEINFTEIFSPAGWPFMLFWWLYMTPAKPRRRTGGANDVKS